ncbi:coiled-coil domain-containing glutamate-rich protein 1 [Erethizon dorsatum]
MTQTLFQKEDPLNLGGGWSSSAHLGTWSSCRRRRRGAPIYKQHYSNGHKPGYVPPWKKPKPQHAPGPWFQPPRRPCWYPNWGRCGGPWRPPPAGFRKPPCLVEMMQVYGLHPLCPCCCFCWCAPWNPGWASPPRRKKRWGRLRRPRRGSFPRSPPVDVSMLLRPVNLYGWRAPGMRAPRNTTQFIMNQIYEDMRQQEKLERQQRAQRAQQARAGSSGDDAPPSYGEENSALQETFYDYLQNPSLILSPAPVQEKESPAPQLVEDEEETGEEEAAETENEDGEEEEEVNEADHEEEGKEEEERRMQERGPEEGQRDEENHLSLEVPLSLLLGAEEEGRDFMGYTYLSLDQMIPDVPQEALFMIPDIDH